MTQMVQYRIQNLLSHLQAHVKPNNPNYNVLEEEHMAWLNGSCVFSVAHKKAWKDTNIPLFASMSFPESNLASLRVCLEYLAGGILLEQLTDEPHTTAQAQNWANIYKQAFRQTLGETKGFAAILKHSVDQVLNVIKDPYQPRLVESNIFLAEGMVKEAADRESPDTEPTLKTYVKARRVTIGTRPFLDIGRWIYKIDIARKVLMHPDITKLEEHVADLVFLANDLYSYKKEWLACGAHHNYITIALRDPITGLRKNDRQGAIDYTCRKFCEVLADFKQQKKVLPSFGKSEDVKVARYIQLMIDVVVANIQWSLTTPRYGHFGIAGTAEAPNWGDVVFNMDPL